ncbi:hypothetical protein NDU88_001704 [Pleurodeles waltl]|uniref:Uncharacterized protein n=1 Tax=Pleurodeles waltl TaxID=8319 RepID=A0AAV7VCP6_PLEWA|nr:hypothetical protein NDU88_001704 [Pleurodeles waltl]
MSGQTGSRPVGWGRRDGSRTPGALLPLDMAAMVSLLVGSRRPSHGPGPIAVLDEKAQAHAPDHKHVDPSWDHS